jgi:hypothetical protein
MALDDYLRPEFFREAPDDWVRRLREISPITESLSHLRFRYWEPHESWNHKEGVWTLYACTPHHMVHPERREQLEKHWSELPGNLRAGRKAMVSDYQCFMWRHYRVDAKPFLILQGDGGTLAHYSPREKRYLDGAGVLSDPFPLGFFKPCPFDNRVMETIWKRDRLVKACNRLDELEKMDRPEALKAEDEEAEKVFRETYLDTMLEILQPQVEFMKWFLGKSESESVFRPAPEGTANAVSQWKDHFVEHGAVIGAGAAKMKKLQVAVA